MSEEVVAPEVPTHSEPEVTSEIDGVDAELTWDNIEDVAPSIEASEGESNEGSDEWDSIGNEESGEKVEAASVEETGESSDKEASEAGDESESASREDQSGEQESAEESGEGSALKLEEMPDDTKILAKVDGELQEITLKEFKNGISGEKAIAKRFSEYDRKEKEFNAQMNEVNEYINDLGNTIRNSSVLEGVSKIAELTGAAPHLVKEALIKELMPEIERRYGLDENELALELKQQENDYLKQKTESENKKLQQEQAQRELQLEVMRTREAHNIDEATWTEALNDLDAKLPPNEPITVETVAEYVNFNRASSRAESILNEWDSSYLENGEVVDALIDSIIESPDYSDADFKEILSNAFGETKKVEAQKAVEKKVESKSKNVKTQKEEVNALFKPETDSSGNEILDWDDLL